MATDKINQALEEAAIKFAGSNKMTLSYEEHFIAGANWQKKQSDIPDIQTSEKIYSEADMYIAIRHVYEATTTDGFFGGNVRFKELYKHFANNKEEILQWQQSK